MRFEFKCAASGNTAIVSLVIGYRVNFASEEYQYYGNCKHSISAPSEVAQGNNAVLVLLNRSNVALVHLDKDDVDNSSDGMAKGRVAAVAPVSVDMINLDTNLGYYDGHTLNGSGLVVSARGFTAELGPHCISKGGAGGRQ